MSISKFLYGRTRLLVAVNNLLAEFWLNIYSHFMKDLVQGLPFLMKNARMQTVSYKTCLNEDGSLDFLPAK